MTDRGRLAHQRSGAPGSGSGCGIAKLRGAAAGACPAALVAVALLMLVVGCCGATAPDANEPNDELNAATELVPGAPADGVLGADDSDVFRCAVPDDAAARPFLVTVRSDSPGDIEFEVGASIPGVWEAITWPGWDAVVKDDRVEVAGSLRKGTVLMFLKGEPGTAYSIAIAWE